MAVKNIDPVDVKQAIKNGQLEVDVKYNQFKDDYKVYLRDRDTEETVLLIEFGEKKITMESMLWPTKGVIVK